jgi:hypothetical protein
MRKVFRAKNFDIARNDNRVQRGKQRTRRDWFDKDRKTRKDNDGWEKKNGKIALKLDWNGGTVFNDELDIVNLDALGRLRFEGWKKSKREALAISWPLR